MFILHVVTQAYFNYIRSCGGGTHPTMRECFDRARGRQMSTVLSSRANNGYHDRKKGARFDAATAALPLSSSRKGGVAKMGLVQKLAGESRIASVW
jgi:hypothetical protein|eukprot:COSAG01_NODE_24819_length_765_cov_1.223724_2_plen_96_part_00